jgi:hypothetical protein
VTIPIPKTWAAGLWSTAEMNVHMRDLLSWFLRPPMCIVRRDKSAQTLPDFGLDPIQWDSVVIDSDGIFDTDDPTRLTAATPGYYLITLQVQWLQDSVNTDTRFHLLYVFNAAGVQQEVVFLHTNQYLQSSESYTNTTTVALNTGDYVIAKARIWLNTTRLAGLDPDNGAYGCQIDMRWVSTL